MGILVLLLFALPILSAGVIPFIKTRYVQPVLLAVTGLSLGGSAGLLWIGEGDLGTPLSFMGEPISFSLHPTPLLIFITLLLALAALLLIKLSRGNEPLSKFQGSLISLSLSFGFIAFISGQFMIRYIALDIVGLMAALTVLGTFRERSRVTPFSLVFILLRLGDLALLAAILLMNHYAQTLNIAEMITAAVALPLEISAWVFGGLIFALLIKLGVWPFDLWVQHVRNQTSRTSFWISGLMMPALGYYLLYRILPIIEAEPLFQWITLGLGLGLLVLTTLFSFLMKPREDARFSRMNSLYSSLVFAVVAMGSSAYLGYYFVGLLLYRLALILTADMENQFSLLVACIPFGLNLAYVLVNLADLSPVFIIAWLILSGAVGLLDWRTFRHRKTRREIIEADVPAAGANGINVGVPTPLAKAAGWINRTIEKGLLIEGFEHLKKAVVGLATWLQKNIEDRFEVVWTWLGRKLTGVSKIEKQFEGGWSWLNKLLVSISEKSFYAIEIGPMEKSDELLDDALHSLSVYEENMLRKTLRWDLAWIPILLVVILFFLVVI